MNKLYAHILLTTTIASSTTCMELQRTKKEILNIQGQPPIALPSDSKLFSLDTLNNLLHTQSSHTNDPEPNSDDATQYLIPVYRPISDTEYLDCRTHTKHQIPQEEKKTLLRTKKPVQNNNDHLKVKLYVSADALINETYSSYQGHWNLNDASLIQACITMNKHKKLVTVIELMHETHKKKITEDCMGKFIYEKHSDNWYSRKTALFFSCLKRYMLTIRDSGEQLPFSADDFCSNSDLAKALNIPRKQNLTVGQVETMTASCPAYKQLLDKVRQIDFSTPSTDINTLYYCFYSTTRVLFEGHPQYNHVKNLNQFVTTAADLLSITEWDSSFRFCSMQNIYDLLTLIQHVTKLYSLQVKDLGYSVLESQLPLTFTETMRDIFKKDYSLENRNIISLFCLLVEQYNTARNNKKTPTNEHYDAYHTQKNLNIVLPDRFNATLFDENCYAFSELVKLTNNTNTLLKTDSKTIQDLINTSYFNTKEQS